MYIVAIGWAYVILMMAITASSIGKALVILILLGVLPLTLFIYVAGGQRRRRRSMAVSNDITGQRDAADPQSDQH
ncbi:hypothetical protein [Thiobacillus denitrificans]|uniref:hypothetical protein n=1 Tax=Thiobacillus denitrificans TaxID=36861 RepID=UPI0009E72F54|nr:hypothetical protein [Thiobacillus denitrificans]